MAKEYAVPVRLILAPRKGRGGLFIQPRDFSAAREVKERQNRERFAGHWKFADPFTGITTTFDELGDYNCGRCNQAVGKKCLIVAVPILDLFAGSCGDWEKSRACDTEMRGLKKKSIAVAGYGIAANGIGYGCHRCPYASRAYRPDSVGRTLYCGLGDFRTFWNACCVLNGAATKKTNTPGTYQVGLPPKYI
jgi:hypothetical protein